ncbi:MAG TPA: hypothetical protein VFV25_00370, partial [Methylibium sp.]
WVLHMRSEVVISFGPGQEISQALDGLTTMSPEAARAWLDEQFVKLGCEPLRPTGKVLIADKLVAIAAAVGHARFVSDVAWARDYVRAASAALGKSAVRVDVPGLTIAY